MKDEAFRWLVYGEGAVPPPLAWRVMAWTFLTLGLLGYLGALVLIVLGHFWWGLASAAVGYLLRRQVRVVAPQLLVAAARDLEEFEPSELP